MSNLTIKSWMIIAGVGIVVVICATAFLIGAAFNQLANPTSSNLFGMFNGFNPASASSNWSPRFNSETFPHESRITERSCAWSEDGNYQADCYQEQSWVQGRMMPGNGMMGHQGRGGGRWGARTQSNPTIVQPTPDAQVSFEQDILPIFETYCTSCHGNQAGLSLETYENVIKGSNHGAVVIPGDPQQSKLIRVVSSGYMPYGGPPLNEEQIQVFVNWVGSGALDD